MTSPRHHLFFLSFFFGGTLSNNYKNLASLSFWHVRYLVAVHSYAFPFLFYIYSSCFILRWLQALYWPSHGVYPHFLNVYASVSLCRNSHCLRQVAAVSGKCTIKPWGRVERPGPREAACHTASPATLCMLPICMFSHFPFVVNIYVEFLRHFGNSNAFLLSFVWKIWNFLCRYFLTGYKFYKSFVETRPGLEIWGRGYRHFFFFRSF